MRVSMLSALLDLVVPSRCVSCGRPGAAACPTCLPRGAPVLVGHADLTVWAATRYGGSARTALVAYKERGRRDLAPALAALLADAVSAFSAAPGVLLVGVPSAAATARERGGDHVARLGQLVSARSGCPIADVLRQRRHVLDSAGLGVAARRANVAGSMHARPPGPGQQALIIDDIVTSGATLAEAARALRGAGWPVLGAAVVAATPRVQPEHAASTASALARHGPAV